MEPHEWNLEAIRIFKQIGFDIIGFGLLYCVVVAVTWWRPVMSRLAPLCVVLGIIVLCLNGTANQLAQPLFAPLNAGSFDTCLSRSKTLVVLAGGQLPHKYTSFATKLRMEKAFEFIRFANSKKVTLNIVLTGGGNKTIYETSESELMRRDLAETKLDEGHNVTIEEASLNTYDNAVFTKKILLKQNRDLNIILITGAVHMNRSRLTFVKQGFTVCPISAPAEELLGNGWGSFNDGEQTISVLNEYFGLVVYLWKGWI